MALPVITAANYNYGAYANPQPVKINTNNAIGEGFLKAASAIGGEVSKANKQEYEQEQAKAKAIQQANAKAIAERTAAEKKIAENTFSWMQQLGKYASENNISTLNSLSNAKKDIEVANLNGSVSFEDYTKRNLALEKAKQDILTFGKLSAEADNMPSGFNIFELKSTKDAANLSLIEGMKNSAVSLKFDPEKAEVVASWQAIDPSKINAVEAAELSGNPEMFDAYLNVSKAKSNISVPVSQIIANPEKYFSVNTRFNFADTNENLSKIASEFDSNQGKAFMTDAVNGYMRLNKDSAAEALMGDIQVEAFYNTHGQAIAEDLLGQEFNPADEKQSMLIKKEIANQVLLRARQIGDRVPNAKNEGAGGINSGIDDNIKGQQAIALGKKLAEGNSNTFTYKFPDYPNSVGVTMTKATNGYVIEIDGQYPRPVTNDEFEIMFGGEVKKDASQEARDLINNVLGKTNAGGGVSLTGLGN
jgi:hypothetical protein